MKRPAPTAADYMYRNATVARPNKTIDFIDYPHVDSPDTYGLGANHIFGGDLRIARMPTRREKERKE
jgi:hypothetical protein